MERTVSRLPEDTFSGAYIICPWCGYRRGDCWEWVTDREAHTICEECSGRYAYVAEYDVTYHAIAVEAEK